MEFEYVELVVTSVIAVAGGGAIGALIQSLAHGRKTSAEAKKLHSEASESVVNAALQISDRLQIQIVQLQEHMDNLDSRNLILKDEVEELRSQNIQMAGKIEMLEIENKKLHQENIILKEKLDDYKGSH